MRAPFAAAIAATLVLGSAHAQTPADTARLTIDDLLNAEELGSVWFSPDGKQVAFTRSSALNGSGGGYDDSSLVGGRVFVAREGGAPTEIAGRPGAHYRVVYSDAWAPGGAGLLLLETSNGQFGLAHWDTRTQKMTTLPGRPANSFPVSAWVSGDRVVYAVISEESPQGPSRGQMLDRLERKWRAAWNGEVPQVTVSSANEVFASSSPAAGALMLADPARGTATKIADGDYVAIFASADGTRIAAIRSAEEIPEPLFPMGRRSELQIFELTKTGAKLVRRYEDLDVGYGAGAWSPSGDRFLIGAKHPAEKKRETRLYEFDARKGVRREIALPAGVSLIDPDTSAGSSLLPLGWIGNHPAAIAIVARPGAAAAADVPKVGTRLDYGESKDLRFDVYAFVNGKAENLSSFAGTSVNQFLAPRGEKFALIAADGALWRVAPGDAAKKVSPPGMAPIMGFALATRYPAPELSSAYFRAGKVERVALVTLESSGLMRRVLDIGNQQLGPARNARQTVAATPDLSTTISRITDRWTTALVLNDGSDRTLATVNAALNARPIAPVESFSYVSGGRELTGWFVIPPGTKPGASLPAIVSVYGGAVYGKEEAPSSAKPGFELPVFSGQLLAAEGFVVIYPSTPLGAGENTDVMGALAGHAVAAVDALAAKGIVDPRRVGVTGQSFGGFSTAAILAARSDRFKAGVAMAGVYDWVYGYGIKSLADTLTDDGRDQVVEMKMVESGQIRLGRPFWKDPAPYIRNSPIFHVEDIDAPLLLLHGDLDMGITGLPGAERMYNALVRAGKHPTLVRYWGEGHVANSQWAIRDQWSRIVTWFRAYLGEG